MRPFLELKPFPERQQGNGFFVDGVSLATILENHETPLYVTSLSAVEQRIQIYSQTLKKHFPHSNIFYACKANFAQPILKAVHQAGIGIDIVSIGEWHAAIKAGFSPQQICFAGVGKKEKDWKETISKGIGYLNVEHIEELESILDFLANRKLDISKMPIISLRLNPCLEIETHPHLKTGALDSKFGILFSHFQDWFEQKKNSFSSEKFYDWIEPLSGIHVHIGSQLMAKSIFVHTVKSVLDCASFLFQNNVFVRHLDFGGGLGVSVHGVHSQGEDIKEHVNFLSNTLKEQIPYYQNLRTLWKSDFSGLFVCLEPGRSVVASSTVFLTSVLYTKVNASSSEKYQFCYVDGGMNDFPRPSIYGAEHFGEIVDFKVSVPHESSDFSYWKIVGPVCESGDYLSQKTLLPMPHKNDIIAFFEGGAYCRSMASEYNLRPLPKEIFIKNHRIES